MRHSKFWIHPALALFLFAPAAAQDGLPVVRVNAAELSLGGRVQTQLNTSSVDSVAPSELMIRRARLELAVKVNEWISGAIAPDFAGNRISLKDAYLNVAVSPGAQLRTGNIKRPFGLLELTSSKRMPVIERGLRIRGLDAADEYSLLSGLGYAGRDIGAQLHGTPSGAPLDFSYAVGVFRGPLHGEIGAQDSYQYVARATVRPAAALAVGAGWNSREFTDGVGAVPGKRRGDAFELDLEYGAFAPGLHVLAELAAGDLDPLDDSRFRGAHLWLGYRTRPISGLIRGIEPVLRVSHSEIDVSGSTPLIGGTLLTPGLNIQLGPNDRVMLNYDVWRSGDGGPDARSFKATMQLAF